MMPCMARVQGYMQSGMQSLCKLLAHNADPLAGFPCISAVKCVSLAPDSNCSCLPHGPFVSCDALVRAQDVVFEEGLNFGALTNTQRHKAHFALAGTQLVELHRICRARPDPPHVP